MRHLTHIEVAALRRESVFSDFAHTYVLQKQGIRGHGSVAWAHACVLLKQADMCIAGRGAVVTWLPVVSSHTRTHVHARLRQNQGSPVQCAHTHVCCRNKESVVTLPVALILF